MMNLPGEYLHDSQLETLENDIRLGFDSPFPGRQPRSVSEYFSPTPRQGLTDLAKCDHLLDGLIPRTEVTTLSRSFSTPQARRPGNERKGIPNVEERWTVTGGGYREGARGLSSSRSANIPSSG